MSRMISTRVAAALFAATAALLTTTSSATTPYPYGYGYGYDYSYMWDSRDITGTYFGYNDPISAEYSYANAYAGHGYNPEHYYNPYYGSTADLSRIERLLSDESYYYYLRNRTTDYRLDLDERLERIFLEEALARLRLELEVARREMELIRRWS